MLLLCVRFISDMLHSMDGKRSWEIGPGRAPGVLVPRPMSEWERVSTKFIPKSKKLAEACAYGLSSELQMSADNYLPSY